MANMEALGMIETKGLTALVEASDAMLKSANVTLFEAHGHFGGHAHTVDVCLPGPRGLCEFGVDTGFLVFNERTYPGLIALFQTLGVRTAPSDMSFSVQAPWGNQGQRVEWNGANLDSVLTLKSRGFIARGIRTHFLPFGLRLCSASRFTA